VNEKSPSTNRRRQQLPISAGVNPSTNRDAAPRTAAALRQIQFTRFRTPDRLSKLVRPHKVEGVKTDGGTEMWRGTFEVVSIDCADGIGAALTAFGKLIDTLGPREAIALGVPKNGLLEGKLLTKEKFKEKLAQGEVLADTITRSLDDLDWSSELNLFLLDADRSDNARGLAIELYPPMADVAMLARPSASASVIHPQTGKPLKNSEHAYVVIDDPSKSRDVLHALIRLAWCTGKGATGGYPKITKAGSVLPYGPFDATVGSPERLSYEGAATVEGGLKQLPRTSALVGDGDGMLCAAAIIARADQVAPEARFRELFEAAKNEPAFAAKVAAIKAAHREAHIAKRVARGETAEQAAREYDRDFVDLPVSHIGDHRYGDRQYKQLPPGYELFKPNGEPFTTDDVARDPWAFVRTTCADPVEGMAYQTTSCGWIDFFGGNVAIFSQAHGGAFAYVIPIDYSKTKFGDALRKLRETLGGNYGFFNKPGAKLPPTGMLMQTSAEFVANFVPPDYLIDGLLQRRYVYSLTGPTGSGKTTIALRIGAHVANGLTLAGREVEKGRVLFFAGENPDDVRSRWIKLCEEMKLDPDTVDMVFMPFTLDLSNADIRKRIDAEAAKHGPFSLLIVDTSAAYYSGNDENDNVALGNHARLLRSFVALPGGPTVLVTCHPTKTPSMDNLLPRGGGAFLAEVDGNLVCIKEATTMVVEITTHGKFRGPDFAPFSFTLVAGQSARLVDSKKRKIWSVFARPISDEEQERIEQSKCSDQDLLLHSMLNRAGGSLTEIAKRLHWLTMDRRPNKQRVQRMMKELHKHKLVEQLRNGGYRLTKKGEQQAAEIVPKDAG
jgi:hypothetical protein